MPQPCIATSSTVSLTVNGSPGVLQADVRLSAQRSQRLLVLTDGLAVPDANFRVERITTSGTFPTGGGYNLIPYDGLKFATPALMGAATGLSLAGLPAGFTVPNGYGGIWQIHYGVCTDGAATVASRSVTELRVNNVAIHDLVRPLVSGDTQLILGGSTLYALSPGDLVNTYFANNDSTVRTHIANANNHLAMSYIGPGL